MSKARTSIRSELLFFRQNRAIGENGKKTGRVIVARYMIVPTITKKRLTKRRRKSLIKKRGNPVSESDRYPVSLWKFGVSPEGLLYSVK